MIKLEKYQYNIVSNLFYNSQFHMTKAVFDGIEGNIFVDDIKNTEFACVILKKYYFISGSYTDKNAKKLYEWLPKNDMIINIQDGWEKMINDYYKGKCETYKRYVMNIPSKFNINSLNLYINRLNSKYELNEINKETLQKIKEQKSFCTNIGMSIDYEKNGIGIYCTENENIVGIATSNIFYKDGIEINIKVNPDKRRQGIASALSAQLILKCLKKNKKPYWDAANDNSYKLATKLGYEFDKNYYVYLIK